MAARTRSGISVSKISHSSPPSGDTGASGRAWAVAAARAADDKLAADTVVIDVGDVLAITDHFVITSGTNTRQVKAIVDEVERQLAEAGGPRPLRVEGLDTMQWVLVDYGSFVVHVFDTETRAYYDLERLWRDRPSIDWRAVAGERSAPLHPAD